MKALISFFVFLVLLSGMQSEELDIRYVYSVQELKTALEQEADVIFVTNPSLSKNCQSIASADKWAIGLAIFSITTGVIALVNEWNPFGWGTTGCSVIAGGTAAFSIGTSALMLVTSLGGTIAGYLYNGYIVESYEKGQYSYGIFWYAKLVKRSAWTKILIYAPNILTLLHKK